MALHLVRFQHQQHILWGVLQQTLIYPLPNSEELPRTSDVIQLGIQQLEKLSQNQPPIQLDTIDLLSPITQDSKIICQGANYKQHMIDSGIDPKQKNFNMFFTKSSAAIHHPVGTINKPKQVKLLDYEIELCLVLKQPIHQEMNIGEDQLHQYIAGVCIGNDISARDIQIPQTQFFKGKSYRTFCPLGPVLCLLAPEDMHYLNDLKLTLKVNGQVRQQDNTANMVFKPAETLTEMSQIIDFNIGDVVMTGTPSGCALSIPSPLLVKIAALLPEDKKWDIFIKKQKSTGRYLNVGDHLELSIQSSDQQIDLGLQKHHVKFL